MTPQIRRTLLVLFGLASLAGGQTVFAPAQNYSIPNPSRPAFADFNGDGRYDMVAISTVVNPTGIGADVNSLYYFPGQAASPGGFGNPVISPAPLLTVSVSQTGALYPGDFDKDNRQDLIAAVGANLLFLKGNGDGTFQAGVSIGVGGNQAERIQVLDLDGDGNLDLLFGARGNIRYGNGDGTFRNAPLVFAVCTDATYNLGIANLQLADVNRDGRLDLVSGCSGSTAAVAYRNADLSFAAPVALNAFAGLVTVNDFNSDGINDIVIVGLAQQVMRLGAMDGTLGAANSISIPTNPESNSVAYVSILSSDFNQDGKTDLLLGTRISLEVDTNNTPGFFANLTSIAAAGYRGGNTLYALELIDLNKDGGLDTYIWNQAADVISVFLTQPPTVFVTSSSNPVTVGSLVTLSAVIASPKTGTVYSNVGTVTFYSGSNVVAGPINVVNGVAAAKATLPQGINYIVAYYQISPGAANVYSAPLALMVTPAACGLGNAGSGVTIVGSGFRFDRLTNQFVQDVDIKNPTGTAIEGPISLMVAGLSSNATLATPYALTTCNSPGTPVVDAGLCPGARLGAGQTIRVTLRFNNPTRAAITYSASTLSGLGQR